MLLMNWPAVGRRHGCCGFVFFRFDRGFESANAFTDPFAQLRELFGTKDKQGDTKNDQQMRGLKQSFKHGALLNLSPSTEFLCNRLSGSFVKRMGPLHDIRHALE